MNPLYTQIEFDNSKHNNLLPLKCNQCSCIFYRSKQRLKTIKSINSNSYCSKKCYGQAIKKSKIVTCKECGKSFTKYLSEIERSPNHFCSRSCSAKYGNKHKKFGTTRSKLEKYIEKQLTNIYPNLTILFNDRKIINSELDIYIPSLNLAFEINGIFHYEPIFGQEKLDKIQSNEKYKIQTCLKNNIELYIIDTSQQKSFKEQSSLKYLTIIKNLINNK